MLSRASDAVAARAMLSPLARDVVARTRAALAARAMSSPLARDVAERTHAMLLPLRDVVRSERTIAPVSVTPTRAR